MPDDNGFGAVADVEPSSFQPVVEPQPVDETPVFDAAPPPPSDFDVSIGNVDSISDAAADVWDGV
jgi:hypothetical protein